MQIKSINGNLLFEGDYASTKEAVQAANRFGLNLRFADLSDADLRGADLRNANLSGATLRDADLWNADLRGANLMAANLAEIKSDFIGAISKLPNEVQNLRDAIIVGKIDGSTYEGECACLAGTIANNIGLNYKELPEVGFVIDCYSPRESWFFGIKKGDTPENSQISAITLEWIDEFLSTFNQPEK